ncbi:MFS general substrate transporter [Aaosphaeria arxii CBS 175.79]|uniref:MFS general substrate transporter n=1 Tax=Aaosphaeria arxii CBS 175.79 TaxID=1450172 RepID=A0A6A5Y2M0_9PLEO|nr:MFS general substrate transporter [Aaosphaeria arxii CBS 175.79]KAF2019486.1 MFS general substrate transporter [Aaosphaeria arxii CBS 175.79]
MASAPAGKESVQEVKPVNNTQDLDSYAKASQRDEDGSTISSPKITFKTKMALLSLIMMYESYLFTLIMPAAVLAYINADLGPDPKYPWITVTWNLGAAVIVTVGGRLADIFGRRWFLLTGATAATIGALVGATGQSINQMIVAGVLFGFGGGFQEMCFACAQELVPNRYRFATLGAMVFANHVSSFGPLISYAFIKYSPIGWRACYWFCFAWEAATAIMLFFFYNPPTFETKHVDDQKTKWQLIKEMDHFGLWLFTGGCLLLLLGLNWGGVSYPWASAHVIAPIVVAFVCFVGLGFWEVYGNLKYPILPPKLFKKWREFTSLLVVCFVAGMLYYSMNVLWPRQSALLFVPADDTIIRGVYANMVSFGTIIAGWYCMCVMPWIGHERLQLTFFIIAQTALIGSMASIGINDKAQAIATVVTVAACNLPPSPLSFGMVSLGLEDQSDIGVAVGLISTFRLIGGAVATSIYVSIYTSRYANSIPGVLKRMVANTGFSGSFPDLLKATALNTPASYAKVAGINPETVQAARQAIKISYVGAFKVVYLVAIAFGVVAILSALSTRSVEKSNKSNAQAVQLETEKKEGEV